MFELLAMLFCTDIGSIFKQQVFRAFKNIFVLLGSFTVLAVTDLVDYSVKSGYTMKEPPAAVFLTALMYGSPICMITASIDFFCLADN